MTVGGMLIMAISVGVVTLLFGWCVHKVLTAPDNTSSRMHGFEQETPDTEHSQKAKLSRGKD
jgi:hypothetical protein